MSLPDRTPKEIRDEVGNTVAIRENIVHVSKSISDNESEGQLVEDVSRAQSAAKQYQMITYKIGDFVIEAGVMYRNITAIATGESFTAAKWKAVDGPSVALEIETVAVLGMANDQNIVAATTTPINYDESFVDGDLTKIVDLGNGIFKLHNGEFVLSTHVQAFATTGGSQNLDIVWAKSSTEGGAYTVILPPNARSAQIHTGNTSQSTQPKAIAFVDAQTVDVFVKVEVLGSGNFTIQKVSTTGSIQSHGTSAVANTPLTTKGDLLTHDGGSEQRLPVSPIDGQVVVVDSGEALGLKYVNAPVEVGRAVVTGAAVDSVVLTLNRKTKYLRINFFAANDTGLLDLKITFNGDNADENGNYTEHESEIFGGSATGTIMDALELGTSDIVTDDYSGEITIDLNLSDKPKLGSMRITAPNGLNTDDEPYVRQASLLWINTSEQIETIEFIDIGVGSGIGVGSEFIAMGWD